MMLRAYAACRHDADATRHADFRQIFHADYADSYAY